MRFILAIIVQVNGYNNLELLQKEISNVLDSENIMHKVGLTWSNSSDLHIKQKQNEQRVKDMYMYMYIQMNSGCMKKKMFTNWSQ